MYENSNVEEISNMQNRLIDIDPLLRAKNRRLEKELNYTRFLLKQRDENLTEVNKMRTSNINDHNLEELSNFSLPQITRERDDLALLVIQLDERLEQSEQYNQELFDQLNKCLQELQLSKLQEKESELQIQSLNKEVQYLALKTQQPGSANLDKTSKPSQLNEDDILLEHSLLASKLKQMQMRLSETELRAQKAEAKVGELEEEIKKNSSKLFRNGNTNSDLDELRAQMVEDKKECNQAKWELNQLRNHTNEMQKIQNERVQQLNIKLTNMQERANKAETDLMQANNELAQLMGKHSAMEKELTNIKKSVATTQMQHLNEVTQIIRTAELRENELRDRLSRLQIEYETKFKEAHHLLAQYRSLIMRIKDEYLTGLEQFDLAIKRMTEKHDKLLKTNRNTKSKLLETLKIRHNLERETGEQIYRNESSQMQLIRLRQELSEKTELILQLEYNIEKLTSDRKILAQELEFIYQSQKNSKSIDSSRGIENGLLYNNIVQDILDNVHKLETYF